jgi:hypothetical protein
MKLYVGVTGGQVEASEKRGQAGFSTATGSLGIASCLMRDTENIKWEEVQSAATKMFSVWVDGTELEWAKEAWSYLAAAGLARATTILDATAANLRLVALARIYQQFCGFAWNENPDTPVDYLAEDLEIDPVALGILAANADPNKFAEFTGNYELREAALLAVTDSQRQEIFECLRASYGDEVRLYSRLWHTRSPVAEENTEYDEFEVTDANSSALEYVRNGFRF